MSYALPADLAWVLDDSHGEPRLYLFPLPTGVPTVLDGNAAAVWTHAVTFGDREVVLDELADTYGVRREVVEQEAVDFLDALVGQGLLRADR